MKAKDDGDQSFDQR